LTPLCSARARAAVLAGVVSVLACGVTAAPSSADTPISGELIGQGIIVNSAGQPTIAGTNNSCGNSLISGCLVVGTPADTSFAPISVTDGFELQAPAPAEWQQLEQSAESTIANLRGVPADRRNQYWARPEIDTLMFLDLIGLIHRRAAGDPNLTAQDQAAVDLLSTKYQQYEKKVADEALSLYNTWAGDPCSFLVPVGDNPKAYQDTLGTACESSASADTPPPTADQFTEWARELVGEDYFRSLVPQVQRFAQVQNAPAMTDNEAQAEVELEYQTAVGSLEQGFSFLIAEKNAAETAPAATQPEATGQLLDSIKEATTYEGLDRAPEVFGDMISAAIKLSDPLRASFFGVDQVTAQKLGGLSDPAQIYEQPIGPLEESAQELQDLVTQAAEQAIFQDVLADQFEVGTELGGLVLGGASAVVAESIQLAQDADVLNTLQANQAAAGAAPDLEALTQSSDGWAKLENTFVDELMPDFTFRKLREPAPDGAAPAASTNDPMFHITPVNGTDTNDSPSILVKDWARPGMLQAISADDGWVTRAPLLGVASDAVTPIPGAPTSADLLGPAVSDTSFNYIDGGGDWWRAWPVRGSLLQVRFATPVGSVSVYRYLTDGLPSDIPCRDNPFGVGVLPTSNGFRCVVGDGTHFKDTLAPGDFVVLGDEVKQVDHVLSDTAFTTTTPFNAESGAIEPIDVGSSLMKIVSGDTNCWNDGNCTTSDTIEYQSRGGGLYTASFGDRPPVIAPSITGTLHPGPLQVDPACDPQGNCDSPSVPTWTFAPGEPLTLDPHAFSPDPGTDLKLVTWKFCQPRPIVGTFCDVEFRFLPEQSQTFTKTFDQPGTWAVTVTVEDTAGKSSGVFTTLTLVKVDQTITPDGLAQATYGSPPQTLTPTASSGLPVDVTSASPSVCTTDGAHGTTITFVGVGQCQLDESQDGNTTYNAAPVVRENIDVGPAHATVHVAPPNVQYSNPVPNLDVLGAVSGLVGTDTLTGTLDGCTASGLTTMSGNVTSPAGSYPLTGCDGLSNPNYTVSYDGALTVTPQDASLVYAGPWLVSTGSAAVTTVNVPLSATVTQAADGTPGDLAKANVDFLIYKSTSTSSTPDFQALRVPADGSGVAATTITLPVGTYMVVVRMTSRDYFAADQASDTLTVYQPTSDVSANAAGWVNDPGAAGNGHGHFGFSVSLKNSSPSGHVTYSWRNPADGYDYVLTSNSWTGGNLSITSNHVSISGKATLTAYDPRTGLAIAGIGGGNYTFLVNAADNGSGNVDTYSIVIRTPSAIVIHSLSQTLLGGGNVAVHN
jgi:hypothetical protein